MAADPGALATILARIDQCIDWQTLYALEDNFNEVGLTIQTTSNKRMVLCKLKNGKPVSNKVIDDYIFIGGLDVSMNEISAAAIEKLKAFVQNASGKKDTVKNVARKWKDGLRMYEASIAIMRDDTEKKKIYPLVEG